MLAQNEFFYCYSPVLFRFLKMEKKINYICTGLHEKTFQQFWQFKTEERLIIALAEYKQRGIKLGVIR